MIELATIIGTLVLFILKKVVFSKERVEKRKKKKKERERNEREKELVEQDSPAIGARLYDLRRRLRLHNRKKKRDSSDPK